MKNILLVEDEPGVVDFVRKGLSESDYQVTVAFDGKSSLDLAARSDFDLMILDIMLPDINGIEVCRRMREANVKAPIIFLTALGTSENIAHGLNMGADDYLVKPFKFIELNARINALLRRSAGKDSEEQNANIYSFGDLVVDDNAKSVVRKGQEIQLTVTEYKLLLLLIRNKNRVLSRQEILENIWDGNHNVETNVVDVYINYLRKKMDTDPATKIIHTVFGMGYVMKEK